MKIDNIKRKNWLPILLVFIMTAVMMPMDVSAADSYDVYVNDTQVTDGNKADVLNDGTVSYDPGTNTLTLNGADTLNKIENKTGIPFTLSVAGENTAKLAVYSSGEKIIDSNAPVTLSGSGTLTLSGTNQNNYIRCINAVGSVTVDGITLIMTNSNDSGIYSTGNITVQNGATVKGDTGYMFNATTAGYGKLTVSDSTVTAPLEGTSVSGWMSAWVNEMEFSNSTVDIVAPNGIYASGNISILNSSDVKVTANGKATPYPGIYSGGAVTITDSTVEAVSYTYSGLLAADDISIADGKVRAVSDADNYAGIYSSKGKLTISGLVTIDTETVSGVSCKADAGVSILTPAEPADAMYEIYAGSNEADATAIENSPFPAGTDLTELIGNSAYFKIDGHTHTGGTATCASPAICETCGHGYGAVNPANHTSLLKAEAKPATHMLEGNREYWYCDGCKKYFNDAAGTQEIQLADTVIEKLPGHTADGTGWHSDADSHWNLCECGEKLNEAAHSFKWVTDNEATSAEAGSKHEECTVCGYKKAAVKIPAVPSKDIDTAAANGRAESTDIPKTGDDSSIIPWTAVMLAAAAALTGAVCKRRKKYSR